MLPSLCDSQKKEVVARYIGPQWGTINEENQRDIQPKRNCHKLSLCIFWFQTFFTSPRNFPYCVTNCNCVIRATVRCHATTTSASIAGSELRLVTWFVLLLEILEKTLYLILNFKGAWNKKNFWFKCLKIKQTPWIFFRTGNSKGCYTPQSSCGIFSNIFLCCLTDRVVLNVA